MFVCLSLSVCLSVCLSVSVCVCVRACVYVCVRACVYALKIVSTDKVSRFLILIMNTEHQWGGGEEVRGERQRSVGGHRQL